MTGFFRATIVITWFLLLYACREEKPGTVPTPTSEPGLMGCSLVSSGFGPAGEDAVRAEPVITGLEVPWSVAVLPGEKDWLLTERPGRVRLVRNLSLVTEPVVTIATAEGGEGGLLGLALAPDFASSSRFFVFYTLSKNGTHVNRVERYVLSSDRTKATPDGVILDDVPAASFHNGGRIRFGPDGMLYVGTGDSRRPELARDESSPNGKVLRLKPDGTIPDDNPTPGRPWFIKGVRNLEAFDWLDSGMLVLADHGPTGEYQGRTGGDEIDVAGKGQDLGWPTAWQCETDSGSVPPILAWVDAVPPGGGIVYRGDDVPAWKGSFIVGTLGSEHLHRVTLGDSEGTPAMSHAVYFQNQFGRIREVFQGPSGELYFTTSNCDSRGSCPSERDAIYRVRSP